VINSGEQKGVSVHMRFSSKRGYMDSGYSFRKCHVVSLLMAFF